MPPSRRRLNGVGSLAATTTKFLEQVARELAAPEAPPAPPAPDKKAIDPEAEADDLEDSERETGEPMPEGRRAMCIDIVRAGRRQMRVYEVRAEAAKRGLNLTAKQVSTVLSRAAAAGLLEARKEGNKNLLYSAPSDDTAAQEADA